MSRETRRIIDRTHFIALHKRGHVAVGLVVIRQNKNVTLTTHHHARDDGGAGFRDDLHVFLLLALTRFTHFTA